MPTWSNAGSLPPGSLPRNISAKSSAIAIFGPSPSFLEENANPTPTPRRWRNMKLSRSQPSTKLGTPSKIMDPVTIKSFSRKSFVLPLLKEKGWSLSDWAIESKADSHAVNDYLNGKRNPYASTRLKLAQALGVEVKYLPE